MSNNTKTIEMPPLDYQYPAELHPETAPVHTVTAAPVEKKTEQQLEQERPVYEEYDNQESDSTISDRDDLSRVEAAPVEEIEETPAKFQQNNFKAMREEAKRVQRERDILEYQLEQMKLQQQEQSRPKQIQEPEIDFDFSMDDDALIDAKQAKILAKQNQNLRKDIQEIKQQNQQARTESQVRAKYPDWERVCSKDNVEKFAKLEPELAQSILQTQDPYLQMISAYKMIKKSGLVVDPIEVSSTMVDDKRRIQQNSTQPRPSASIAPSSASKPLSNVSDYSVGRVNRTQLEEENRRMNSIIRGPR